MKLFTSLESAKFAQYHLSSEAEIVAEVNAAAAEVNEETAVVTQDATAVNDCIEGVETIEEVNEIVEEKVEQGEGINKETAVMMEAAVNSLRKRFGIQTSAYQIPAAENFALASSSLESSKLALEEGKNMLVTFWNKIKEYFMKMVNWIVERVKTMLKNYDGLKAYATRLKSKVAAVGEAGDKKVKKSGATKYFGNADESFARADVVLKALAQAKPDPAPIEEKDLLEFLAGAKEDTDEYFKTLANIIGDAFGIMFACSVSKSGNETVLSGVSGGLKVIITAGDGKISFSTASVEAGKDESEAAPASKKNITDLIGTCEKSIEQGSKLKDALSNAKKHLEKAIKTVEAAAKKTDGEGKEKAKEGAKAAVSLISATLAINAFTGKYHFATIKHALDLAAQNIACYKGADKDGKKD